MAQETKVESEKASNINPQTLKTVIGGILNTAREQRKDEPRYKELIDIHERNGLAAMLREAEHQMTSIVLDIAQVLEEKHGRLTNDAYIMISALPLLQDDFERLVIEEQGHRVDCTPKSFYRIASTILCLIADRDNPQLTINPA